MKLLVAASNGTGLSKPFSSSRHRRKHHLYTLYLSGVEDSATVDLEVSDDPLDVTDAASTWFKVPNASPIVTTTFPTVLNVEVKAIKARAVVASGLGSESLTLSLW